MPPDNDALGLYRYVGSLTHPVRYHSKTIFYTPTVGADRIRPWHKAPLRGACVLGRLIVGLQLACTIQLGASWNPRLRADAIRPYSWSRKLVGI